MTKRSLLLPLLALLLCVACSKQATFTLNEPFNLLLDERAVYSSNRSTSVQFLRVKEDSRCPRFTNCVWEGQAVVVLAIGEDNPIELEFVLRPGGGQSSQRVGLLVYELQALSPYPSAEQGNKAPAEPQPPQVTLLVQAP